MTGNGIHGIRVARLQAGQDTNFTLMQAGVSRESWGGERGDLGRIEKLQASF